MTLLHRSLFLGCGATLAGCGQGTTGVSSAIPPSGVAAFPASGQVREPSRIAKTRVYQSSTPSRVTHKRHRQTPTARSHPDSPYGTLIDVGGTLYSTSILNYGCGSGTVFAITTP